MSSMPRAVALFAVLFAILFALPVAVAVAAAEKPVPFLSGRVVDEAGMIPADVRQRIEQKLAAFEQRTGIQVAVLTVDSLDGAPIEDYSMRVVETWKLGKKGKDNGVLLLVSKQDRKLRIEVGYGLEGQLTDLKSGRITDNVIRPDFQKGDFGAGIEHGVDAILAALGGGEVPAGPPAAEARKERAPAGFILLLVLVLGTFSLLALTTRGVHSWFLYLFLMPFYAIFPGFLFPGIGIAGLIAWAVLFPIFKLLFFRAGTGGRFGGGRGPWGGGFWGGGGGFGGFGGGGGSWGGGGGGFSGGGGGFGGGGASGSW